jgi:hypothetical protein
MFGSHSEVWLILYWLNPPNPNSEAFRVRNQVFLWLFNFIILLGLEIEHVMSKISGHTNRRSPSTLSRLPWFHRVENWDKMTFWCHNFAHKIKHYLLLRRVIIEKSQRSKILCPRSPPWTGSSCLEHLPRPWRVLSSHKIDRGYRRIPRKTIFIVSAFFEK